MNFQEWIGQVVIHLANKYRKDETEVYSSIDLSDVPEEYDNNW